MQINVANSAFRFRKPFQSDYFAESLVNIRVSFFFRNCSPGCFPSRSNNNFSYGHRTRGKSFGTSRKAAACAKVLDKAKTEEINYEGYCKKKYTRSITSYYCREAKSHLMGHDRIARSGGRSTLVSCSRSSTLYIYCRFRVLGTRERTFRCGATILCLRNKQPAKSTTWRSRKRESGR